MKKTIICLHGMRTGRYHDFSLFARIIKKEHPEYDVQLLEYYDPLNKKTLKTNAFYTTVKSEVEKLSDGYDDVTLVGYSMGGPLALIPWAANSDRINRVVLLSPTFNVSIFNIWKLLLHSMMRNRAGKRMRKSHTKGITWNDEQKKRVNPLRIIIQYSRFKRRKWKSCVLNWEACRGKDILCIASRDDEFLPVKVIGWGVKKLRKCDAKIDVVWKEKMSHTWIFTPYHKEELLSIIEWIGKK